MQFIKRIIRRLRGIQASAAEVSLVLESEMTQEEAIRLAVAGLHAVLKHEGTDPLAGSVEHHFHDFDGREVLHARWIHDVKRAEQEAAAA
jgi:hypothetical protein